ncbi:MAG: cytochrome o ubiquinol oxidase subunit IV [Gammaproteobacteria bacterium]|nr:cytochrome o ubiquinol oxidase subunit IV [Gammaproteobacteria bacterium]
MTDHSLHQPDYGTGQKKLGIYLLGFVACSILTLLAFWVVMADTLTHGQIFAVIYGSACLQFVIQLVCFLRLNTLTPQGRTNVMSFVFTLVILVTIIAGSLWIMRNMNYNMMH